MKKERKIKEGRNEETGREENRQEDKNIRQEPGGVRPSFR